MTSEIIEGNKAIAEFMGCYGSTFWAGGEEVYRYGFKDTHITERWDESKFETETPYHSSWDWLMPVVEKIAKIVYEEGFEDGGKKVFDTAYPRTFGMIDDETGHFMVRINRCQLFKAPTLIEAAWLAVVYFINH